jgi:predicted  nucleic acid-binding Zn-ribbon protein
MKTNRSSTPCWFGHRTFALAGLVLFGAAALAGCAGADRAASPQAQVQPGGSGKADDFVVVDCLLPGQVRRLGAQATFLTARRPIKTSARDCEIRGGEYVSYDRANYATALQVWLPRAKDGDANAQTYVGEIFEKGLGLPPDHAAAAEWYRRAAQSGYSRAAINLGHLYEQGLGVPKDPREALTWYRRAAGLGDLPLNVTLASTGQTAEVQQLRQEVGELRRQLQTKQGELERTQGDLDRVRRTLTDRRNEADAERDALGKLRRELEESRDRERAASARLREIDTSIADRETRLSSREREATDLRASLKKVEAESDAKRAEADRLLAQSRTESGARRAELERQHQATAAELARTQQELDTTRRTLDQRVREAGVERDALGKLRRDLEESRGREQAAATRLRELGTSVGEREARLTAKEREVADLRTSLTRSETEASSLRAELERLRQRTTAAAAAPTAVATAGPEIHLIEPQLIPTRGTRAVRAPASVDKMLVVGRVDAAGELLSLTINGREERLDSGNLFKTSVPVVRQSDERVQIVAIDRAGRRATLEFLVLNRPDGQMAGAAGSDEKIGLMRPGGMKFGSYHALVIGNNDYKNLRRLRTAVNDAREVARILGTDYGFKVTLLLNANRYETLSALNAMRERLTDKDNLLVYYAGHGELDQKNQRGNWLPVDAEPNSTANWISNIQITDILNALNAQQVLVVADSCYSGTMTRSGLLLLEGALTDDAQLKVIQQMAQKRSRMVLTSGGVEPVLDSTGGMHSAFAQIFIELLRGNGGVLPGQEMFRLLQLRVASVAQRLETQQVPEYAPIKFAGHEAGDFFFVKSGS